MTDRLDGERIQAALSGHMIGTQIRVMQETTSTNDLAAEWGRAGEPGGLVVFAERQTRGRGRLGRVWDSAQGAGLWFSILLRPEWSVQNWSRLSTWAAVGIAEGLEAVSGCAAWVKWPNDIYIQDRKAVGILIESFIEKNGFVVVGIGINVNQQGFPPPLDETAISLRLVSGQVFEREAVAVAVLEALNQRYRQLVYDFPEIVESARQRSFLNNRAITWEVAGHVRRGVVDGLDTDGGLIVRTDNGRVEVLASGEVTLSFQR